MSYPYIMQGENVVLVIDSEPHTINKTHMSYSEILESIKNNEWDRVKELINPVKRLVNFSQGNIAVVDGEMFWRGQPFHNALATRIIQMLKDGFDINPMINFMNNLMQNPSKRAVDELYGFLEKNSLPITPDGHFLAYKRVRGNYLDCHSGTMDNSVGNFVEMERNQVDDDRDRTCSTGLHFCSEAYLKSFGGERTMIVKINPKDVVSIPSDYNDSKGRACRYEVIGEVGRDPNDSVEFNKPVQTNANSVTKTSWPFPTDKSEPKFGATPFYKGYTDGFTGKDYDPGNNYWSMTDQNNYEEGYDKGQMHKDDGIAERYRYVDPGEARGFWPNPISFTK
jgi:hypothetical protein